MARQLFAEGAKAEIAGFWPSGTGARLLVRSEAALLLGKQKFTAKDGSDLFGFQISEEAEVEQAEADTSGTEESLSKKTRARNGNAYLAYSQSSAMRLPQNSDWNLALLDGNQRRLWDQPLDKDVRVNAVLHLISGNCLLGGLVQKSGKNTDLWLALFDTRGKMLWQKVRGGKSAEAVLALSEDREGRIFASGFCSPDSVFLGNTDELSGKDIDGFIMFLDKNGDEKFFYRQRGKGTCRVEQLVSLDNGNLLFVSSLGGNDWKLPPFGFPRKGLQDIVIGLIDPRSGKEKDNPLRIFPNPAKETVYFSLSKTGWKGKASAYLQQKDGTILQEMEIKAEPGLNYRFNVSNTRPGPYFISIKGGKKEIKERLQVE